MRFFYYIAFFCMGMILGTLLMYRIHLKRMQELKDHPPECITVETYYL